MGKTGLVQTKADKIGLAALVAVLLALAVVVLSPSDNEVASQEVSTGAPAASQRSAATTAPLAMPTPTPLPPAMPTAIEVVTTTPEVEPSATEVLDAASPAATAESIPAVTTASGAENPQPAPTEARPNPQPQATANPQPGTASAPAPAPTGGTFTRTLTATVARPTLYTQPGGSPFTPTFNSTALPAVNPTVFGKPLVYRVLAGSPGDDWAQIYVPARPNGTRAWVQTSQFQWGSSNRLIRINIANNTVTVYDGDSVLLTTGAVTGKSSSPTPLAQGWVEEIIPGPSSAYGPTLISLGIFSDALNSFGGSVPKIALHGTNNPALMGQYASNGCIRVKNEIITQIAGMVAPGSRVEIVRA